MLTICESPLPQSLLSYVAFRVAFKESFQRYSLHKSRTGDGSEAYGFLSEVPFLRDVPLQVQVDLLAGTWARHLSRDWHSADLVDESVVYAACETTAKLLERSPTVFVGHVNGGPFDLSIPADPCLIRELRLLYLELPNGGDFLLVDQFLDLAPGDSARSKLEMGIDSRKMECLFDVLGNWNLSREFLPRLRGLLTESEIQEVAATLC